jgi:peptide deformylase
VLAKETPSLMPPLSIRLYGDPMLRQQARPIQQVTDRHRQLARDMAETMYEAKGVGLAANQVGHLERLIVADTEWADDKSEPQVRKPIVMINPEILDESVEDDAVSEGCLSLPEIEGDVWRPVRIRYRYLDAQGNAVEAEATGLKARCILHEIDHLNGVLFIDHLAPDAREKLAGKLTALRQQNPSSDAA